MMKRQRVPVHIDERCIANGFFEPHNSHRIHNELIGTEYSFTDADTDDDQLLCCNSSPSVGFEIWRGGLSPTRAILR